MKKNHSGHMVFAGFVFFLSGAVSLIYQVVWIKNFSLQMGSAAWSISSVVAAFMAGLGIGSWWAGRNAQRWGQAFRIYGIMEMTISIYGIISIVLLKHLDFFIEPVYRTLSSQFPIFILFQVSFVFIFLFIPTSLMGASLPVLVVGMSKNRNFEKSIGFLYGINTLGAAFGVILSGFILLPYMGILKTTLSASFLGFFVAVISIVFSYLKIDLENNPSPKVSVVNPNQIFPKNHFNFQLGFIAFICGALSIFYEVCWTRLLTPILGSSTYAFSIILTTFLIGIGLGGIIASSKFFVRPKNRLTICFLLVVNSIFIIGSLHLLNHLPLLFSYLAGHANDRAWFFFVSQGLVASSIVFLPTLVMGILFPLIVSEYNLQTGDKGQAIGKIYLLNTLGAILGSLLAGFICLPWLGAYKSFLIATIAQFGIGLYCSLLRENNLSINERIYVSINIIPFTLLAFSAPKPDWGILQSSVFEGIFGSSEGRKSVIKTDIPPIFIKEGLNTTVAVSRTIDNTMLVTDGEAQADLSYGLVPQYMLAYLPLFLHPNPQNICIIGLGSGATTRAAASHPVKKIDVIELEPAVVKALRFFEPSIDNLLEIPKVRLHLEDGRAFIKYSPEKYDIIISQPSHPWVTGVGSLFTQDFYQIIKEKLSSKGILCQWVQAYGISDRTLNAIFHTLSKSFKHVEVFEYNSELMCLASENDIKGTLANYRKRSQEPDIQFLFERMGFKDTYPLYANYIASFPDDLENFPSTDVNSDDNLFLEYRAPLEMYQDVTPPLKPLPAHIITERIKAKFYPDGDKKFIVKNFANSLINRPRFYSYLDELIEDTKDPEISQNLEEIKFRLSIKKDLSKALPRLSQALKNKDFSTAANLMETIKKSEPKSQRIHQSLVAVYFEQGKIDQALENAEAGLKIYPYNIQLLIDSGRIYFLKNNLVEAQKKFEKASLLHPLMIAPQANLVAFLKASKQHGEADAVLKRCKKNFGKTRFLALNEEVKSLLSRDYFGSPPLNRY